MVRKIKPIIYIFCEGQTEKNYFTKLNKILRSASFKVKTFDLKGGTKIMEQPNKIKAFIKNKLKHDKISFLTQKIFIVFDLDIFIDKAKLQNTQNELKDYGLIYNNECFEYWLLSHFKKYDLGKGKNKYLIELKEYLLGLPELPDLLEYKMTGRNDFDWLNEENIKLAINNVKEVNNLSTGNLKDIEPYSNVYEIIEFLESN